jgi:hypothetical protein
MMFHFLKFLILLLTSTFLFQGLLFCLLLVIFYASGGTSKGITYANFFSLHLIVGDNMDENLGFVYAYDAINMLTHFFLIFMVSFFWVRQVRYQRHLDETDKTDADFAVFIKNLEPNSKNRHILAALGRAGVNKEDVVYVNR